MPSSSHVPVKSSFTRAVDALCLSREDIARALKLTTALLDAYTSGAEPVPSMTQLELVDVLKSHEAMLGAVAGSLYEETMYLLQRDGSAAAELSQRPPTPLDRPSSPPGRTP